MFTFNTTAAVEASASAPRSDGGVKTLGMTPIAEGMFKSRLYAGAVYHPQRKSILYFGGFQQGVVFEKTAYITEFVIGTGVWSVITTSGTSPPPLANHCMAQSEDGNTMVVYGGRVPAEYTPTTTTTSFTYSGVLYLFNIPTLSWSKVSDSKPRFNIACTIIGNHKFMAWGGSNGMSTITEPPVVFNLKRMDWTHCLVLRVRPSMLPILAALVGMVHQRQTNRPMGLERRATISR